MKTATVRDLRNNFAQVSSWISAGQEVEITKRGKVMARLVPVQPPTQKRIKWNSEMRLKRLHEASGHATLPGNSALIMREGGHW